MVTNQIVQFLSADVEDSRSLVSAQQMLEIICCREINVPDLVEFAKFDALFTVFPNDLEFSCRPHSLKRSHSTPSEFCYKG